MFQTEVVLFRGWWGWLLGNIWDVLGRAELDSQNPYGGVWDNPLLPPPSLMEG